MSTRNDENINSVPTTLEYQPIDPVCLEDELKELQCVQKALNDDWEAEALKYEETLANGQPRRNYFNAAGVVEDPRLFPYHDVFYMLIDAYDGLYGPDEPQPMPPSSVRPSYVPLEQRRVVEDLNNHLADLGNDRPDGFCYLPCSPLSVSASVMEVHSSVNTSNTPTGGHTWTVWQILSDMFHEGKTREEIQIPQMQPLRMNLLPHERTTLYLRLLRHAMSELQRDYNLASSIIQRMCENQDLDDPDVLRRFLIVFDGEFIACENPCPQWLGEDHSCMEWATVVDVLHAAVSRGISLITLQHATVLAAFVRASYLNEFGHLLDKKDTTNSEGFATKRKTLLKRAVVALSYVDRTDSNRVPIQLVVTLVRGLGSRAWLERRRLTAALRRDVVVEGQLRAYLDSYWNCIRSLVAMGEATVELLPSEADCFEAIASEIVKNLAYAFLPEANVPDYRVQEESIEYLKPDAHPSLITPGRYSDCVANATDRWKRIAQLRRRVQVGGRDALACALDVVRPDDVREVIRSLFIRDMVNIRQAGLGYGDFLLWCGYEVHPLDPVLFWHEYQYPIEEDNDNSDDFDEGENDYERWDTDEADHKLSLDEMKSRYNFTLMALLRVWNSPWSPSTHRSFQPAFQEAVKTVALSTHRLNFPNEITARVASFMNRSWWPDIRRQCWSYDCQVDQLMKKANRWARVGPNAPIRKSTICKPCAACGVSWYCSTRCKDEDFKQGHKWICNSFQHPPSPEEENALYQTIFKDEIVPALVCFEIEHENGEVIEKEEVNPGHTDIADSEGSWESMDTGEDEDENEEGSASSETRVIVQYFKGIGHRSRN